MHILQDLEPAKVFSYFEKNGLKDVCLTYSEKDLKTFSIDNNSEFKVDPNTVEITDSSIENNNIYYLYNYVF